MHLRDAEEPPFATADVTLGMAPSAGLYHRLLTFDDVAALLREAVALGVGSVDTAPLYGCGRSELDIGRALRDGPALEVTTKAGRYTVPRTEADPADARVEWGDRCYDTTRDTGGDVCVADYTGAGIRRSVAQSRRRLRVPDGAPIPQLRLHDAEVEWKVEEALAPGGAVDALVELRAAGAVGRIGLGMNDPAMVLRLLRARPGVFDTALLAGCWNLLDHSGEEALRECEAQSVEVHIAGVFGAGLLWGGDKYRYSNADPAVLGRRAALQQLCDAHGVPLPWFAAHFATRPAAVGRLVVGCATAAELTQCVATITADVAPAAAAALYRDAARDGLLPLASVPVEAQRWAVPRIGVASPSSLQHVVVESAVAAAGATELHAQLKAAALDGSVASGGWTGWLPRCLQGEAGSDEDRVNFMGAVIAVDFRHWIAEDEAAAAPGQRQLYTGTGPDRLRGSMAMVTLLRDAVDGGHGHWYRPAALATMTPELLAAMMPVVGDDGEAVVFPALPERAAILRSIGQLWAERRASFFTLLRQARRRLFNDGRGFVELLAAAVPRFRDAYAVEAGAVSWHGMLRGPPPPNAELVHVMKLAQLLPVALINSRADYGPAVRSLADFEDAAGLAVCADYQLPKALRAAGLLTYTPALAAAVDGGAALPAGSPEEFEVRAGTVAAAAALLQWARAECGDRATPAVLDYVLWRYGRGLTTRHHLTVTSMY